MGDVKFADYNNDSQCFQILKYNNYYKLSIFTPQEEVHIGEVFIMGQLSGRKDRIIYEFKTLHSITYSLLPVNVVLLLSNTY